jgi:hypothetical protein
VNSLQFWPDLAASLGELRRVLLPEGRLLLVLRMRREAVGRFDRSRYGMSEERLAEVALALERAGFRQTKTDRREIRGETLTAILSRA